MSLIPVDRKLVIERIAMRLLNNHLRLHAGQIGQLPDQGFVAASQNASQSRLNRRRRARRHQRRVTIRQLEHFCDTLAGGHLQLRNAHKVAPGHGHHRFELRMGKGTAQHGHGPLAVNHGCNAELFVGIAGLSKAANPRACASGGRRFAENNLRGANIELAITPTLPRKLRRFHFELSRMNEAPLPLTWK